MGATLVIGGMHEVATRVSGWATTVVSAVGDHVPPQALPPSYANARHLLLQFRDTTDATDPGAFTRTLADRLVAFGRSTPDTGDERIVVHCAAGIGRSTAVAYVLLTAAGRPAADALAEVLRVRPAARPNPLVIARCDPLLARTLWGPFEAWGRQQPWWSLPPVTDLDDDARLTAMRHERVKRPAGTPKPRRSKRTDPT